MVVTSMNTENLPRVPDTHGDMIDEKLFSDLYIRTTWVDAKIALDQIDKGKAKGNRTSVYLRSIFQYHLQSLGWTVERHAGKIIFVAILVLSMFCVGLKSAQIHSKVNQLWIQEGGRLEKELAYTQQAIGEVDSSTHQLIIQTAHDPNVSVLHSQALLTHLDVLKQASSVTVHLYEAEWSLNDMCNKPSIPSLEEYVIEGIFDAIIPCSIITPLDCFWEGSKLLGPDHPVILPGMDQKIQWTSLNPQSILQYMKKKIGDQFVFDSLEQYMERAGISTGYIEKPCLNPRDPMCPITAPNKNSFQLPDVGEILTGGCYGYASKYMHWPEELIIGDVTRNRSGHLKKAKGLQSVVQLMTEKEMFDSWKENYKVSHIDGWSREKAGEVLNAWQKKFTNKVNMLLKSPKIENHYEIYVFSSASLDDILQEFSNPSPSSIVIGTAAIVLYTFFSLMKWKDPIKRQSCISVAGVLLIGMSTAAGLGLCALLGIVFNAATTQVIPFLALGLGVDHIFTLTAAYANCDNYEEAKNILKKVGPSILFSSGSIIGSFLAAFFIPVPALKVFCLQAAVVMCFNLAAALLVFPALISLDLKRRSAGRADILCCCFPFWKEKFEKNKSINKTDSFNNKLNESIHDCDRDLRQQEHKLLNISRKSISKFSFSQFAFQYYTPFLMKSSVKFFSMLAFIISILFSLFSSFHLQDGLDLIDLVPKNTNEYKFLNAQTTMFGFYNMFAVTQGNFEYPTNQKLLHEYHEAFVRVPHVIKNDNGGPPDFWLTMFRDWLLNLQIKFDREFKEGRLNQERWFSNASIDAILAYKLLVQTGYVDNPVDKSLVTVNRLVFPDGIINPKAFYNYMSAWATNDAFAYGACQGKLRPEPRIYQHSVLDYDLKIPKSLPLVYTQLPFYLHNLKNTNEIKTLISHVRDLSVKFEQRGLPNYPSGIPFIFWEQYMTLRTSLMLILLSSLFAAFFLVLFFLLSVWASFLVVVNVFFVLIQIFGAITFMGIKLSAIPAVIIIISIGLVVCFTVQISLGFITSVGNRERRIMLSMQVSMGPLIHGILTSLIAVLMLSMSTFEFVVRHFFWLFLAVLLIGAVDSILFFPIILSLIGPEAELVPIEYLNRISTPSPIISRSRRNHNKTVVVNGKSRCKDHYHHKHIIVPEPSLTTITEEPPSWKSSSSSIGTCYEKQNNFKQYHQPTMTNTESNKFNKTSNGNGNKGVKDDFNLNSNSYSELQSIVVQPEVTVETTQNGSDSSTTRVTATANIKVELVTPNRSRSYNRCS